MSKFIRKTNDNNVTIIKKTFVEYDSFETFKNNLCKKIEIGLSQVENGECRPIEELFEEMDTGFGVY